MGHTVWPGLVMALDGRRELPKEVVGGKAWSVNRMRALGLPVPPAFVLTTDCCADFYARGRLLSDTIWEQVVQGITALEAGTGRQFGGSKHPLLLSVRSGAAVSMPGMMDTVLNLGMNDDVLRALAAETGSLEYANDTYERFQIEYRKTVLTDTQDVIPADPWEQLQAAIAAVFLSWKSPRAQAYRRHHGVDDAMGTAVTVQAMVFGNLDDESGTGVLFSRNPSTGDGPAWGEWLVCGQGEDVVSGRTTPEPLDVLAEANPHIHRQLCEYAEVLERVGRDIQDIEFTVESGRLWLLQARPAKRSPRAAVRAAVAMVDEGLIAEDEAVARVTAGQLRLLLKPELSGEISGEPLVTGEPACPGLASGTVVTDPDEAEERSDAGEDVVLVRSTTSPEDFHGMVAARAIITERGGSTSHAAVVSREIGRPCIVGCGEGAVALLGGRMVTVDGSGGKVWAGKVDGVASDEAAIRDLIRLAEWATARARLSVFRTSEFDPQQVGGVSPVDLDAAGEEWRTALVGAEGARGDVLETDEGIHAAVTAGLKFVVVRHKTPALQSALEHERAGRLEGAR